MASYKVLTLNCCGLNSPVKRRRLVAALHKEHPDVVFLQETHIKLLTSRILSSNRYVHQFHAPGTSKARGVAILISKDLQVSVSAIFSDPDGRFLFVNCKINEARYTLASIYAPNIHQISFLTTLFQKLRDFKTGEILLGGDLNYVCDPLKDRSAVSGRCRKRSVSRYTPSLSKLSQLFDQYDLVDTWRTLYPSARQYTFFSSPHGVYSRIDFILSSKVLFNLIRSADIGVRSLSDHAWVSCLLERSNPTKTG